MAETQIYKREAHHFAPMEEGRKVEPGSATEERQITTGQDTHYFGIPAGKFFSRCVVTIDPKSSSKASATVAKAPPPGATGKQSILVKWDHHGGGLIYYITVYAT